MAACPGTLSGNRSITSNAPNPKPVMPPPDTPEDTLNCGGAGKILSTRTVRVIAVELLPAAMEADDVQVTKFRNTVHVQPAAAPGLMLPGAAVKPFALSVV